MGNPDAGVDVFFDKVDVAMYIVTVASASGPSGCLVGFSTQCSIKPPRLLVCLSEKDHTYRSVLLTVCLNMLVR
ncbi:MAG: flavin reductase [Actinomycetota bacterium]